MDTNYTPGYRIKLLRKERRLSQEELAAALSQKYAGVNIKKPMISLYESDQSKPPPETLDALADFFGVSLDWLRCRSEIRNPDKQLAALAFPDDVLSLARKLTALPHGMRREISNYTDELVELITATRAKQIGQLRKRAEVEPDWEKRHGIKITD